MKCNGEYPISKSAPLQNRVFGQVRIRKRDLDYIWVASNVHHIYQLIPKPFFDKVRPALNTTSTAQTILCRSPEFFVRIGFVRLTWNDPPAAIGIVPVNEVLPKAFRKGNYGL
jgi:hypothetical protein